MWLNPAQLAGLPGLPTSQKSIREWLHKHAIPSRPRQAKGGGMEYDCAALPQKLRTAIAARQIATAGSTALAQVDTAPVVSFAPPEKPLPAPLAPMPEPNRRPPSLTDKATADARMLLVNMLEGRFISPYDDEIATRIASVLSGGAVDRGSLVDEEWLLGLERRHFVELAQQEKTQARIGHMLKTGKPLRN